MKSVINTEVIKYSNHQASEAKTKEEVSKLIKEFYFKNDSIDNANRKNVTDVSYHTFTIVLIPHLISYYVNITVLLRRILWCSHGRIPGKSLGDEYECGGHLRLFVLSPGRRFLTGLDARVGLSGRNIG